MRENGDEASVSPSVGEFIRKQRKLADLSLRQMAELTHVSTPISARSSVDSTSRRRVLRSIADALDISAETLLAQTGVFTPLMARRTPPLRQRSTDTETAIPNDPPDTRRPRRGLPASTGAFESHRATDGTVARRSPPRRTRTTTGRRCVGDRTGTIGKPCRAADSAPTKQPRADTSTPESITTPTPAATASAAAAQ